MKYGFDDVRDVLERASARETAARVAAGAVCRRLLEEFGVAVHSHTVSIGDVCAAVDGEPDWAAVEESPVRCADADASERMVGAIDAAREAGDTLGGAFEMRATGVPIGLGSHVMWDRKLDGLLAQAVMSIHAVKGVEIGGGFALTSTPGSLAHDVILPPDKWDGRPWRRATNRAGGLEGGITNGEPVVVRGALKPISTLSKPLPSVDLVTGEEIRAHYERSDVCTVPAAGVVGEAMVAIVLARAMLEKFGGDSLVETRRNFEAYQKSIGPRGVPNAIHRSPPLETGLAPARHVFRDTIRQLLRSSGPAATHEIYEHVRLKHPEFCDDSIECRCGGVESGQPEWKHQVRWAEQDLKYAGEVRLVGDQWSPV
jgi:chorismate synthase